MINGVLPRKGCPADKNTQASDISCEKLIFLSVILQHVQQLNDVYKSSSV